MGKPNRIKSKWQVRREASASAAARLNTLTRERYTTDLLAVLQPKLDSGDPRTMWLANEALCAVKHLMGPVPVTLQNPNWDRLARAINELFQVTEHCDGMVTRRWPMAVRMDRIEMSIMMKHASMAEVYFEEGKAEDQKIFGYTLVEQDFSELARHQKRVSRKYPYIYTDNPYYQNIIPTGTPIVDPTTPAKLKDSGLTVEGIFDLLVMIPAYQYEAYRLKVAEKLHFRTAALDREVEWRRKSILGGKAAV